MSSSSVDTQTIYELSPEDEKVKDILSKVCSEVCSLDGDIFTIKDGNGEVVIQRSGIEFIDNGINRHQIKVTREILGDVFINGKIEYKINGEENVFGLPLVIRIDEINSYCFEAFGKIYLVECDHMGNLAELIESHNSAFSNYLKSIIGSLQNELTQSINTLLFQKLLINLQDQIGELKSERRDLLNRVKEAESDSKWYKSMVFDLLPIIAQAAKSDKDTPQRRAAIKVLKRFHNDGAET